ncbi:hypothetical protein COV13_03535 [Candidatus Woesearchaeota archaeon CG10_big_fil_rev_8_21_14_0_10_32_9]|nr:MAG: hypothetical protein COV13_03535 [Candidatus Woesearchaeota archaeon CG10_big_fil_rev_8_21_14_0_10_32_9]
MKLIRDPLYRIIEIEDEFLPIIDNPYFQRLRFIKQDANIFYLYPSSKQDRFSHSLGAYHLMKQVVNNQVLKLTKTQKFNLKAAALLHDIGHGAYSHTWEKLRSDFDHEKISSEIIRKIFKLPEVAKIIEKKSPFYPLISSVIDVDKMDYMARDSYFSGVGYGVTDLDRIVTYLGVKDKKITIVPKIVTSVEHVIIGRISLFKSMYFHHTIIAKDEILVNIFKRVHDLYKNKKTPFLDPLLEKMLYKDFELNDFLDFNDSTVEFHLDKWRTAEDPILRDLVTRYLTREGFLALDLEHYNIDINKIKKEIAKKFPLKYYYCVETRGKQLYQSEAMIKINSKLVPLSEFSEHIKKIKDMNINKKFLIGPKEILKKYKTKF